MDNNIHFYISSKLELGESKYCYILNIFFGDLYLRFGDLEIIFLSACKFEFVEFMHLESCAFTLNKYLVIGKKKSSYKKEILCYFALLTFELEV